MAIFESESWLIAEGKHKEHDEEMHRWFKWVNEHQELFPEWKSVRYFEKHAAGDDSGRLVGRDGEQDRNENESAAGPDQGSERPGYEAKEGKESKVFQFWFILGDPPDEAGWGPVIPSARDRERYV